MVANASNKGTPDRMVAVELFCCSFSYHPCTKSVGVQTEQELVDQGSRKVVKQLCGVKGVNGKKVKLFSSFAVGTYKFYIDLLHWLPCNTTYLC